MKDKEINVFSLVDLISNSDMGTTIDVYENGGLLFSLMGLAGVGKQEKYYLEAQITIEGFIDDVKFLNSGTEIIVFPKSEASGNWQAFIVSKPTTVEPA